MKLHNKTLLVSLSAVLVVGSTASAATFNATSGGAWNVAANWSDTQVPPFTTTATVDIDLDTSTTVINQIYRVESPGTTFYSGGQTYQGTINLDRGTFQLDHYFGTGSNGVFNIGDGTGPANDAVVSLLSGGTWEIDRHNSGVFTVNIASDGAIVGTGTGKLQTYNNGANDQWVINLLGGSITTAADWVIQDTGFNDASLLNISAGGTVDVGAVTVGSNDVIDFTDTDLTSSFTADYGGSFADITAVNAALGSTFTATGGGTLQAVDNGGSFTVSLVPEPGSLALLGIGGLLLARRRRN